MHVRLAHGLLHIAVLARSADGGQPRQFSLTKGSLGGLLKSGLPPWGSRRPRNGVSAAPFLLAASAAAYRPCVGESMGRSFFYAQTGFHRPEPTSMPLARVTIVH